MRGRIYGRTFCGFCVYIDIQALAKGFDFQVGGTFVLVCKLPLGLNTSAVPTPAAAAEIDWLILSTWRDSSSFAPATASARLVFMSLTFMMYLDSSSFTSDTNSSLLLLKLSSGRPGVGVYDNIFGLFQFFGPFIQDV